jgi:hypothetical protein
MQKIRNLTAALSVLMFFSLTVPTGAQGLSEGGFTYTESGGVATVTGCESDCPYVLNFPATLGGYPVTTIGTNAFAGKNITSVTLPNSVTTVESGAFGSNLLTSLTLSSELVNIGDYAFYDNRLTSVSIPSLVTNLGAGAFAANLLNSVTFMGNAPATGGSNVFDLNELLVGVSRYSNATGWGAEFLGLPVSVIELPATSREGSAALLAAVLLAALAAAFGLTLATQSGGRAGEVREDTCSPGQRD